MQGNSEISDVKIADSVLIDLNIELSKTNSELIKQHGVNYSSSPVAKDSVSFAVLETMLGNQVILKEELYSKNFEIDNGNINIRMFIF